MPYRKLAEFFQQLTRTATNPYYITLDNYSNQVDSLQAHAFFFFISKFSLKCSNYCPVWQSSLGLSFGRFSLLLDETGAKIIHTVLWTHKHSLCTLTLSGVINDVICQGHCHNIIFKKKQEQNLNNYFNSFFRLKKSCSHPPILCNYSVWLLCK